MPPATNHNPRAGLQGRHVLFSTSSPQRNQSLGMAAHLFNRSAQSHTNSKGQRAFVMPECGVLFKKQHRYKVPKQHTTREGELNNGCVVQGLSLTL